MSCRQALLVHDDARIAEWVRQRIPYVQSFENSVAFGVLENNEIVGGVVFNNYRGFDIHMSAALDCALTKQNLRTLCDYAFGQLNVRRVTSITGKKNRKARKALRILGFIEEGTCRYALDGKSDAVVYGLLREKCRWL